MISVRKRKKAFLERKNNFIPLTKVFVEGCGEVLFAKSILPEIKKIKKGI